MSPKPAPPWRATARGGPGPTTGRTGAAGRHGERPCHRTTPRRRRSTARHHHRRPGRARLPSRPRSGGRAGGTPARAPPPSDWSDTYLAPCTAGVSPAHLEHSATKRGAGASALCSRRQPSGSDSRRPTHLPAPAAWAPRGRAEAVSSPSDWAGSPERDPAA